MTWNNTINVVRAVALEFVIVGTYTFSRDNLIRDKKRLHLF